MEYNYDLTGADPQYASERRFVVYASDQMIEFKEPVFAESLVLSRITASTPVELVVNRDWAIPDTCIDSDAISTAKLQNMAFSKTLVKSVMVRTFGTVGASHQISVKMQRFSMPAGEAVDLDGNGPEYSPALMLKVLQDISYLRQLRDPKNMNVVGDLNSVKMLDTDIHCAEPNNRIIDEAHSINVPAGVHFIRPEHGAFYDNDLILKRLNTVTATINNLPTTGYFDVYRAGTTGNGYPLLTADMQKTYAVYADNRTTIKATKQITRPVIDSRTGLVLVSQSDIDAGLVATYTEEVVMVRDRDYTVGGLNHSKTALTTTEHQVVEFIYFLIPLVGTVKVTYWAFGGNVSTKDLGRVVGGLNEALTILKSGDLLTASILASTPVVKELSRRLATVEEYHKHFLQTELPVAHTDNLRHWYSIATLWDENWGGMDTRVNDLGMFRVESLGRNWIYDFTLGTTTFGSDTTYDLKTVGFSDANYSRTLSKLSKPDIISTRLVWIGNGKSSGVVLQIGIPHSMYVAGKVNRDVIVITNKSGNASRWKLIPADTNVVFPEDNEVSMPNGTDVWTTLVTNNQCYAAKRVLTPTNGMLFFSGNIPLKNCATPVELKSLFPDVASILTVNEIEDIEFTVYDRKENTTVSCKTNGDYYGMFYVPDMCGIIIIPKIVSGKLVMSVESLLGSSSYFNDRFDLRSIVLHTK